MDKDKLDTILKKHKKWLNNEEGGEWAYLRGADLSSADLTGADLTCADLTDADLTDVDLSGAKLRGADLSGANLSDANLRGADLRGTNLSGATLTDANLIDSDLDYSAWPLWCGSLQVHVDDKIAIQLLHHTLSVIKHSNHVSDDLKEKLLTDTNLEFANRFCPRHDSEPL